MKKIAVLLVSIVLILNSSFAQKTKLKVGKNAPNFDLAMYEGENKTLEGLLEENDFVLIHFFIGSWYSYDKAFLSELQGIYPDLQSKKCELLAITRDRAVFLKALQAEIQFEFPIGLDADLSAMSSFGALFKLSHNNAPSKLKEYSSLNAKHTGSKDNMLPVPASFLINKEGKIIWMHYEPDYRRRPKTKEILEQIK